MPTVDIHTAVERIFAHAPARLVLATPLGLGKPNALLNAVYTRAKAEPQRALTIFTALSLALPRGKSPLESAFLDQFSARHFGADYPALAWTEDLRHNAVPAHIHIREFYLQSGTWLGNAAIQREYTSLNYTHVARELATQGVDVLAVLVAERDGRYSLSCNPDLALDLLDAVHAVGGKRPLVVGCVHADLPFMGNDAEIPADWFDLLIGPEAHRHQLFALPREPVTIPEHALGLLAAALVRDGGTLQIGIGALADALVHGCLLRERDPEAFAGLVRGLQPAALPLLQSIGGCTPFARGLYGASEMVMDGFMHLVEAGIVRRRVYDHLGLQHALNAHLIDTRLDAQSLARMREAGLLPARLDEHDVAQLQHFGVLPAGVAADGRNLLLPDRRVIANDLDLAGTREALGALSAGRSLVNGHFLAGAFFLGSKRLYEWLRGLDEERRDAINMTRVSHINQLYGGREALDAAQRTQARFFNTTMMVTLSGAAVSDGLDNGQVVSGVGGQYNFVAMAHALPTGRSILLLRAVRGSGAEARSNIVPNYGHCTIPRHLRDLVVTEYGIADLRGKSDEEVAIALIEVADARFQPQLIGAAQAAGKLRRDFELSAQARNNTPERLAQTLRTSGISFPTFPFGSDFEAEELQLIAAMKKLKARTATLGGRLGSFFRALRTSAPDAAESAMLARVGLAAPAGFAERTLARLLAAELRAGGSRST